jgi:hypothetical protein
VQIQGSIRTNLLAAISSARRHRGLPVHADTISHWRRLAAYARHVSVQPQAEVFGDLLAQLDEELTRTHQP